MKRIYKQVLIGTATKQCVHSIHLIKVHYGDPLVLLL